MTINDSNVYLILIALLYPTIFRGIDFLQLLAKILLSKCTFLSFFFHFKLLTSARDDAMNETIIYLVMVLFRCL